MNEKFGIVFANIIKKIDVVKHFFYFSQKNYINFEIMLQKRHCVCLRRKYLFFLSLFPPATNYFLPNHCYRCNGSNNNME